MSDHKMESIHLPSGTDSLFPIKGKTNKHLSAHYQNDKHNDDIPVISINTQTHSYGNENTQKFHTAKQQTEEDNLPFTFVSLDVSVSVWVWVWVLVLIKCHESISRSE